MDDYTWDKDNYVFQIKSSERERKELIDWGLHKLQETESTKEARAAMKGPRILKTERLNIKGILDCLKKFKPRADKKACVCLQSVDQTMMISTLVEQIDICYSLQAINVQQEHNVQKGIKFIL